MGIIYGTTIGVIKGDTRSLDYSSYIYIYVGTEEDFASQSATDADMKESAFKVPGCVGWLLKKHG